MGWLTKMLVLAVLQYISPGGAAPGPYPNPAVSDNFLEASDSSRDDNTGLLPEQQDTEKMDLIGTYLTELLLLPANGRGLPILYVEDETDDDALNGVEGVGPEQEYATGISQAPFKRSRYYRKYPWKRQNSRQTYDAENRYLCQPSKDDVFRLLVALHEARQGTRGRTINFCNRKRPATAIFTNIRFLG